MPTPTTVSGLIDLSMLHIRRTRPQRVEYLLLKYKSVKDRVCQRVSVLTLRRVALISRSIIAMSGVCHRSCIQASVKGGGISILGSETSEYLSVSDVSGVVAYRDRLSRLVSQRGVGLMVRTTSIPDAARITEVVGCSYSGGSVTFVIGPNCFNGSMDLPRFCCPGGGCSCVSSRLTVGNGLLLRRRSNGLDCQLYSALKSLMTRRIRSCQYRYYPTRCKRGNCFSVCSCT